MKKFVIALFLSVALGVAHGQIQFPYILNPATVAPSGGCAGPQIQVLGSNGHVWTCNAGTWADSDSAGSGTVTSVGLTLNADFTVTGSPVTTSGTLAADWATPPTGTGAMVRAISPILTTAVLGSSTATSQSTGDNSTKLATTAYVQSQMGNRYKLASTPISNTGNTTKNFLGAITIPAGVMGTQSILHVVVKLAGCSAAGSPIAACAGINTGSCTFNGYFSNTSNSQTNINLQAIGTAGTAVAFDMVIANAGSLSIQTVDWYNVAVASVVNANPKAQAVNTANASFLNFYNTNSVSGDMCVIDAAYAELIP